MKADENYVRESIVMSGSKIVFGFKPIMPLRSRASSVTIN